MESSLPDVLHGVHVERPEDGPDVPLVGRPRAGDLAHHGAALGDVVVVEVVVEALGVALLHQPVGHARGHHAVDHLLLQA